MDGANAKVVGFFFCVSFELDALTLAAEWSFRATYPATIASKPLKPNPSPTLIADRIIVHVGEEVNEST